MASGRDIIKSAGDFDGAENPHRITPEDNEAVRSCYVELGDLKEQMPEGYVSAAGGYNDPALDPAVSERQRRFMGAELRRKREGHQTKTGMTESQLRDYAKK